MTKYLATIVASGLLLSATSGMAKVQLPGNVTTKPFGGGRNQAIDAIDYSFEATKPVDFSRMKMCVATNLTNDEVQLRDSAGSFVGSSGTYYRTNNTSTVQGGGVFKYVDDPAKSLVARGSVSRQGGFGGIIGTAIRFDLEVSAAASAVKMRMLNIESAMKNTGSASNDGFNPVGVWTGSPYKKNIQALDGVAEKLKSCFTS